MSRGYQVGDKVRHKTFGEGTVVKIDDDTVHIRFTRLGSVKKLLRDYAPIEKMNS